MVKPEKIKQVEEVKKLAEQAKAIYFADFTGLTVEEVTKLRRMLREKNVVFKVAKNLRAKFALRELGYPEDKLDEVLHGPNALVIAYEDPVEAVKLIFAFRKELDIEKPKLRAGFLEGEFLDAAQVEAISKLPGKDELRAKVVGAVGAPLYGLVFTLKSMLNSLVWTLSAIKDKREKEEG